MDSVHPECVPQEETFTLGMGKINSFRRLKSHVSFAHIFFLTHQNRKAVSPSQNPRAPQDEFQQEWQRFFSMYPDACYTTEMVGKEKWLEIHGPGSFWRIHPYQINIQKGKARTRPAVADSLLTSISHLPKRAWTLISARFFLLYYGNGQSTAHLALA